MTALQITQAEFNGQILPVIDHQDEACFTAESIGSALEYADPKDVLTIFERNREELEEYSTTLNLRAIDGKMRDTRVFNEEGTMLITMLSRQPKACEFRKWAVGVLKAVRHGHMEAITDQARHYQQQLVDIQGKYIALLEKPKRRSGRHRPVTFEEVDRIVKLSDSGVSNAQIGRELERHVCTIRQVVQGRHPLCEAYLTWELAKPEEQLQ